MIFLSMASFLTQYLNNYTEAETVGLTSIPFSLYGSCLVIPVYDEDEDRIAKVVSKLDLSRKVLLILVANAPPGSADSTRELAIQIRRHHRAKWTGAHLNCLLTFTPAIDLLLIDRCSERLEIPRRQGVGLARKIGADIATHLICEGIVTDPWIHTTDADVCLPAGYFDALANGPDGRRGAILFPFHHIAPPDLSQAALLYELSLHYYVRALQWAGSPYGYHSIGSTLAIHFESYAMVRGFPKRAAGEDFYLLNKLAKVAGISSLPDHVIEIEARESRRTPFGTGVNLSRIKALEAPLDQYLFYHPGIFRLLKVWLAELGTVWEDGQPELTNHSTSELDDEQIKSLDDCLTSLKAPHAIARGFQQYRSADTFERFLHEWFDAFKTLKFVHFLRDHTYPSVTLREMLSAPFMSDVAADMTDVAAESAANPSRTDAVRPRPNSQLEGIVEKARLMPDYH